MTKELRPLYFTLRRRLLPVFGHRYAHGYSVGGYLFCYYFLRHNCEDEKKNCAP